MMERNIPSGGQKELYRALVLDWDGTLVRSVWEKMKVGVAVGAAYGLLRNVYRPSFWGFIHDSNHMPAELYGARVWDEGFLSEKRKDAYRELPGEVPEKEEREREARKRFIDDIVNHYVDAMVGHTEKGVTGAVHKLEFPGEDLLTYATEHGVPVGIATNEKRRVVETVLAHHNVDPTRVAVACSSDYAGKTRPYEGKIAAMESLVAMFEARGIGKHEIAIVDDRPESFTSLPGCFGGVQRVLIHTPFYRRFPPQVHFGTKMKSVDRVIGHISDIALSLALPVPVSATPHAFIKSSE